MLDQMDTTRHGENIADQIQMHDAYGHFNVLTLADVFAIVDNLHTHFLDNGEPSKIMRMLDGWMDQIRQMEQDGEFADTLTKSLKSMPGIFAKSEVTQ